MESVEKAIYTRLTGDTTLQNLLGASGRIRHAQENVLPLDAGTVTFTNVSVIPGFVDFMTDVELYQFNIYSNKAESIRDRIRRLLEGYQFPTPTDVGIKSCMFDWEGGDEFDVPLQVEVKRIRFRIAICRFSQAPV
jgi:hypothetical protein